MFGDNPRVNPLESRKRLLVAQSELNRAQLVQEWVAMTVGARTLTGGVYCFASSAGLTGILTLDGQGNPDAVFVFKIGSTLITATNSSVILTGGAQAKNVWWQVTSSATLNSNTVFIGNIIALTSITIDTGSTILGRALARTGAVTMNANAAAALP